MPRPLSPSVAQIKISADRSEDDGQEPRDGDVRRSHAAVNIVEGEDAGAIEPSTASITIASARGRDSAK